MMLYGVSFEDRCFEMARLYVYGRKKPSTLMQRLGLVYRKGKTEEDIRTAYKRASNMSDVGVDGLQKFAEKLAKEIVKSA